jgi:hypothetical protein
VLPEERRLQFLDDLEVIGKSCAEVLEKAAAAGASESPPRRR